jgi:1-deoxy-D-xylulose-5-phosphate synthase
VEPAKVMSALPVGKGEVRREGRKVAILAFGAMLEAALGAAEELNATVANMRFVKPIDHELVFRLATTHDLLVTVEENVVTGGAGSAVLESLAVQSLAAQVLQLGLPDSFVEHGDPAQLIADCGLDSAGIVASVRARIGAAQQGARPGMAA